MTLSKAVVVLTSAVLVAGCSSSDKHISQPSNSYPFAASYWTEGEFRMQRVASVTYNGSMQSVMDSLSSGGSVEDLIKHAQNESYDDQNRFVATELKVFPQSQESNLSSEGSTALLIEHFYQSATGNLLDTAVLHMWDNWWDGASGRFQQQITWTDGGFEHDIPTTSLEEVINYSTADDSQTVTSQHESSITLIYNDQHLLIERQVDRDGDTGNGYEDSETWSRDEQGRLLAIVNGDGVPTASYSYSATGALAEATMFSSDGTVTSQSSFIYTVFDGHPAVVIEKSNYNEFSGWTYETEVRLYEEKGCHTTTKNRLRFDRPDYSSCADVRAW